MVAHDRLISYARPKELKRGSTNSSNSSIFSVLYRFGQNVCVFSDIDRAMRTTLSRWDGLKAYLESDRTPLYCGEDGTVTKGFVRSYKNLFFYWILGAGHFVSHLIPSQLYDRHPYLSYFDFLVLT